MARSRSPAPRCSVPDPLDAHLAGGCGMAPAQAFDVIVVGGGLAGSALAGVLAHAGLGVLVVEREAAFRDRIRGELTWPWGVGEARELGLEAVLQQAGRVELPAVQ